MKYYIALIALLLVSSINAKDLYKELLGKLEEDENLLIKLQSDAKENIAFDENDEDLPGLDTSYQKDQKDELEVFLNKDGEPLDEFSTNENMPVIRGEYEKDHVADGDIMYEEGREEMVYDEHDVHNDGLLSTRYRWPGGVVPYEVHSSLTSSSQARTVISQAIQEYAQKTCIKFRRRSSSDRNYLLLYKGSGCWSYVGNIQRGRQLVSLGNGCHWKSTAIHELMHAIGFYHEQSRPDRDSYIRVNTQNIRKGTEGNFRKQPSSRVGFFGQQYDYSSVMHYSRFAFSSNRQPTLTAKIGNPSRTLGQPFRTGILTSNDAAQINAMYQCSGTVTTTRAPVTTTRRPVVTTTRRPVVTTPRPGGNCNQIKSSLAGMKSSLTGVIGSINRILTSLQGDFSK